VGPDCQGNDGHHPGESDRRAEHLASCHCSKLAGKGIGERRPSGRAEQPVDAVTGRCDPDNGHCDHARRDPELAELLRREQQQLPAALAEPDVSFIVTPVEAEAHFVRDYDGEIKPADDNRAIAGD